MSKNLKLLIQIVLLIVEKKSIQKNNTQGRGFLTLKKYQQLFGKGFVQNLSIVDLIMNTGPGATEILDGANLDFKRDNDYSTNSLK